MKKKIFILVIMIFLLTGCGLNNTPKSMVEDLFTKYQRLDSDINSGIDSVLDEQNLTTEHRNSKLLVDQYKNLSYEIKDERIDGKNAYVTVEIKVNDYKGAINNLTFDSNLYTKESFDEEKLNRLEATKDKVTYTLELNLIKDEDNKWKLNALTNEQLKKIQGMY